MTVTDAKVNMRLMAKTAHIGVIGKLILNPLLGKSKLTFLLKV